VREAAALALGKIGGPAARRALEALAAGDDERLAEAATEALEELMFNSTHLDDALEDSDGSASSRARAARPADEDLIFDDADEDTDDFDQDDDEYDGDDWDDDTDGFDDPDEEDDSFDEAEDDRDFDDVDLD